MSKYNLGFISDEDIYSHARNTVMQNLCAIELDSRFVLDFIVGFAKMANIARKIEKDGRRKLFRLWNEQKHIYMIAPYCEKELTQRKKINIRIDMQDKLLHDKLAICFLVDVNAEEPQDMAWAFPVNGQVYLNERIRLISTNNLCGMLLNDEQAFAKIIAILPVIYKDVLQNVKSA